MEKKSYSNYTLTLNSFMTSKSGLNTTLTPSDECDFSRSRIEHLPSYHKTDLSHKPHFVIVFQTIEIERLSQ